MAPMHVWFTTPEPGQLLVVIDRNHSEALATLNAFPAGVARVITSAKSKGAVGSGPLAYVLITDLGEQVEEAQRILAAAMVGGSYEVDRAVHVGALRSHPGGWRAAAKEALMGGRYAILHHRDGMLELEMRETSFESRRLLHQALAAAGVTKPRIRRGADQVMRSDAVPCSDAQLAAVMMVFSAASVSSVIAPLEPPSP